MSLLPRTYVPIARPLNQKGTHVEGYFSDELRRAERIINNNVIFQYFDAPEVLIEEMNSRKLSVHIPQLKTLPVKTLTEIERFEPALLELQWFVIALISELTVATLGNLAVLYDTEDFSKIEGVLGKIYRT